MDANDLHRVCVSFSPPPPIYILYKNRKTAQSISGSKFVSTRLKQSETADGFSFLDLYCFYEAQLLSIPDVVYMNQHSF